MASTIMAGALLIGLAITGAAVIMILLDRHETSLKEFAVLGLFCSVLIMISYYVQLRTPGFAAKVDALKFGYIGKVFVNPLLLMLAVKYYDANFGRLWQLLLFLFPSATLYFVFTYESNQLYYQTVLLRADGLLRIVPGPMYYIYIAYNTVLTMIYISFCLYQRQKLAAREKRNNTLLLLSSIVPFMTLLLYLSGWTRGYDITTLGVMLGAFCVALSVFHYGLLNKEEMLQNMATGLIFLDADYKLVYANRKAKQIVPALGTPIIRSQRMDLKQLCNADFASIQVSGASYQRKITEWSNGEGQHGKLITFDDITEIRARLNRDAMTGLLNHASFYPMLDDAMAESNQNSEPLTVSIADIDSFKKINDTYGHANGDVILLALADTLQKICGEKGDVFRYGGEEFAVIFHCDLNTAENIMQNARDAFSAMKFEFLPRAVTFSYGSAAFDQLETSVALFDRADQLMYTRKNAFHAKEREDAAKQNPLQNAAQESAQ